MKINALTKLTPIDTKKLSTPSYSRHKTAMRDMKMKSPIMAAKRLSLANIPNDRYD